LTQLIKYNAARHALAVARQVDEVKDIRDKAEAMRLYGQMAKDKQLEVDAAEIRIRAERRLGELIAAQKATVGLNRGTRVQGRDTTGSSVVVADDRRQTLAQVGISKDLSSRAQAIAAVPEAQFEKEVGKWRDRVEAEGARVTTRLVAAGQKAQKEQPGSDAFLSPAEEMEIQANQLRQLEEQVASLSASDQGVELAKQVAMRQNAEDQVLAEMDKNARYSRELDALRKWQGQVVQIVGAKDPKDALRLIRQSFKGATV
jgi:hypothetical protein